MGWTGKDDRGVPRTTLGKSFNSPEKKKGKSLPKGRGQYDPGGTFESWGGLQNKKAKGKKKVFF